MKEKETINAIGHCIGYGPKNAKYFFWGLEEKKGKESKNTQKRNEAYINKFNGKNYYVLTNEEIYSDCPECRDEDRENKASIYNTYKMLYKRLSGDEDIDDSDFGNSKKSILIGNLYPFAKEGTNSSYTKEEEEWLQNNGEDRIKHIIDCLVRKAEKNYVFCFGRLEKYMLYFCEFGKTSFEKQLFNSDTYNSNVYYKADGLNIYLLRHPSRRWLTEKQVCKLLNKLRPEAELNCDEL